jgi:uncharacterized membrane protein
MDLTSLLKFAHVLAAVLWVGGGFTVILAGLLLQGRGLAETQLAVVRATTLLAPRLFIPASILTLATGVALLFVAGWGWQPFTILGLGGVIFTSVFGATVLGPSCDRAVRLGDAEGATAALPILRRTYRLAVMDYAVQFALVFLMVVKPGWQDMAIFAGLAAVIALATLTALRPVPRIAV